MLIVLAPMEGVVDYFVRDILTRIGGYNLCVTEFIRVTENLYPKRVFYHYCPELQTKGKTKAGVPVFIQLLGSDINCMAENAALAAALGAPGIDLNFGCPSKKVNSHDGGCVLLDSPERVFKIIQAVRKAVPLNIPVTAKIRLGVKDKSLALENARAVEDAGAARLTVHARTKEEGYRPPAHWEWIAKIKEVVHLPVIANGEIWNLHHYLDCRKISGCEDIMLGRGAITTPDLGLEIYCWKNYLVFEKKGWPGIIQYLCELYEVMKAQNSTNYTASRLKQWLGFMKQIYPGASTLFDQIKREKDPYSIYQILQQATWMEPV